VTRLSGIETAADRLRGQLAAADASLSQRDSTVQLLTADKAYLSKEVQVRYTCAVFPGSCRHSCAGCRTAVSMLGRLPALSTNPEPYKLRAAADTCDMPM
jgi:hypothetical protein